MSGVAIKNSVLFVTGASHEKGIGQALIEEALSRGAKKVYASARRASQLDDLVAKHHGKVIAIELDVTNENQIQAAVKDAGDTQILINNAGLCGFSGCTHNFCEETTRAEFEVNFFAPLKLMHAFSEEIIRNKPGAFVNVISIAALSPFPPAMGYSASKAALYSLTQAARVELYPHQIPVYAAFPGPIDTNMAKDLNVAKESAQNVAKRILNAMEEGKEDILTDRIADFFSSYLKKDEKAIEALKKEFGI